MKKILSSIIFSIVIFTCGYLVIANIMHILYLNKYDTFDFNSNIMTIINTNINTLESNIKKISKLDNSTFTQDDLDKINDNLNKGLDNIKTNMLLKYEGIQKFYLKDLLAMDLASQSSIGENINLLNILVKYDESINECKNVYISDFLSAAYNNDFSLQEAIQAYKYNTRDFFNANVYEPVNRRILARIYNLNDSVVKENYLAALVLKIGGENNE